MLWLGCDHCLTVLVVCDRLLLTEHCSTIWNISINMILLDGKKSWFLKAGF